jgi:hypothetical protein
MVLAEITRVAESCDQTLPLCYLPAAERLWQRQDDEDEGGWIPGKRIGPLLARSLNPTK